MSHTHVWLSLVIFSALFAGCTGSTAAPNKAADQPPSVVEATGEPLADAGTIRATVVDDSAMPISGATVGITDLGLNAATDESGTALFTNLPPGTHQVAAAQLGFTASAKMVTVLAGEETGVTLTLVTIVIEVPFHDTFGPFQGYFECRMGATTVASTWTAACGTVSVPAVGFVGPGTAGVNPFPNDNSILRFHVANNDTETAIGEMKWSPSAVGTSTSLRFAFSFTGRPSTHWWCAGEGPSPLTWRWEAEGESQCANKGSSDAEPVPRTHNDEGEPIEMRVYANAPFGTLENPMYLTLQQRFEILATTFYHAPAPEGYSGFVDS